MRVKVECGPFQFSPNIHSCVGEMHQAGIPGVSIQRHWSAADGGAPTINLSAEVAVRVPWIMWGRSISAIECNGSLAISSRGMAREIPRLAESRCITIGWFWNSVAGHITGGPIGDMLHLVKWAPGCDRLRLRLWPTPIAAGWPLPFFLGKGPSPVAAAAHAKTATVLPAISSPIHFWREIAGAFRVR